MVNTKIKVLLVDDHAVVRAGFKMLLATQENINVIGEADRGETAIQLYKQLKPDIVIIDLSMPGIGGLETIKRIVQRDEQARILVFSVHDEQVFVNRALLSGAKGYICKNSAPEILLEAIAQVMAGKVYVEQGLVRQSSIQTEEPISLNHVIEQLSSREFDIFRLLAKGYSTPEIAQQMCLSNKTIANYTTQIRKKLHARTLREVVQLSTMLDLSSAP